MTFQSRRPPTPPTCGWCGNPLDGAGPFCSGSCADKAAQRDRERAQYEEDMERRVCRVLARCNVAPPELAGAYAPLGEKLAAPLAKCVWAALRHSEYGGYDVMSDDPWERILKDLEGEHP